MDAPLYDLPPRRGPAMEELSRYSFETFNGLWWSFVGVVAFALGSRLFDKLDPIDYKAQIEKGNVAAAIRLSAVLLGLAGIIITATTLTAAGEVSASTSYEPIVRISSRMRIGN